MSIKLVKVFYGNLNLKQRDSEKIRGYLLNKYIDNDLMHNHNEEKFIYRYPRVQYKVIDNKPVLIGIEEAVDLISKIGIIEDEINIEGIKFDVSTKNIVKEDLNIEVLNDYVEYDFLTPWIAINQKNISKYKNSNKFEREEILEKILIGNILSMSKSLGVFIDKKIYCKVNLEEIKVDLKNIKYIAFKGSFSVNINLVNYLGVGKAVSKGFGTIKRKE